MTIMGKCDDSSSPTKNLVFFRLQIWVKAKHEPVAFVKHRPFSLYRGCDGDGDDIHDKIGDILDG